jgi:hypothetical protein
MSKDESKRVDPSDAQQITDESLEKVAGGWIIDDTVWREPTDPIFRTTVVTITDPTPVLDPIVPLPPVAE